MFSICFSVFSFACNLKFGGKRRTLLRNAFAELIQTTAVENEAIAAHSGVESQT
jgi:hypothetical protein